MRNKIAQIGTLAFLGALLLNSATVQATSEVTGSLSSGMGTDSSGTLAGTVTGGSSNGSGADNQAAQSSGGSGISLGGTSFIGGGGIGYFGSGPSQTLPGAPYAGGASYAYGYGYDGYDSSSGLAYSSYPDVPYAGASTLGNQSGNTSLMAGAASAGGIGTAIAVAAAIVGVAAISVAAYGLNHTYRRRRGL